MSVLGIFTTYLGKYTTRRWGAHFAVCLGKWCYHCYNTLETVEELFDLYCPDACHPMHLFVTLHWLSQYPTWDVFETTWKRDRKTLQEYVRNGLHVLYKNLNEVQII
jgi:hypothetical protein